MKLETKRRLSMLLLAVAVVFWLLRQLALAALLVVLVVQLARAVAAWLGGRLARQRAGGGNGCPFHQAFLAAAQFAVRQALECSWRRWQIPFRAPCCLNAWLLPSERHLCRCAAGA